MAIARLTETLGAAHTTSGNYDTAIGAPASTPNGVCVVIVQTGTALDSVTTVTYGITTGAVPLTERRFTPIATEAGAVYLYWAAGVVFPSGAQTLRIAKTAVNVRAACCPMTVAVGQQVAVDNDTSSVSTTAVANPAWAMATTAAPTECYLGIVSGITTMVNTPAANWVLIGTGFEDVGAQGRGWARRTMASAGAAAPGWTIATAEDYAGASVAFKEIPLNVPPPKWRGLPAGTRRQRAAHRAATW
jgi:hypothetical protein